jgi:hypothetical protein
MFYKEDFCVAICNTCGFAYDGKRIGEYCPVCSCGDFLFRYMADGGTVLFDALRCANLGIRRFEFPDEFALNRLFEVEFKTEIDLTGNPLPEGFTYKRGGLAVLERKNEDVTIPKQRRYDDYSATASVIYKKYPCDMSFRRYARQLAADKHALIEWVYRFPSMRDYE